MPNVQRLRPCHLHGRAFSEVLVRLAQIRNDGGHAPTSFRRTGRGDCPRRPDTRQFGIQGRRDRTPIPGCVVRLEIEQPHQHEGIENRAIEQIPISLDPLPLEQAVRDFTVPAVRVVDRLKGREPIALGQQALPPRECRAVGIERGAQCLCVRIQFVDENRLSSQ